jgi:hypothetical protein
MTLRTVWRQKGPAAQPCLKFLDTSMFCLPAFDKKSSPHVQGMHTHMSDNKKKGREVLAKGVFGSDKAFLPCLSCAN